MSRCIPLERWIGGATQRTAAGFRRHMQRGMSLLASVGSTAPFIGLFGTVWIICHTLAKLRVHAADLYQAMPQIAAGLVLTSLGLAVAVPALMGYNLLASRQGRILSDLRQFALEVWVALLAKGQ